MDFKGLHKEYPHIKKKIMNRLLTVMERGDFIMGEEVIELEERLAEFVGTEKCLSCGNATDGLIMSLMAIDLKKDDVVFVPDFSYIATASCVALLGGIPAFVDIDINTYNISVESLEQAVVEARKKGLVCRAVITVDLFGQPADYYEIKKIANKYNLLIIEDGAQGFGGEIDRKKTCSFGDISVTSFFPAKPLGAYGDGGAIFVNDKVSYNKLWSLRSNGRTAQDKYDNIVVGINSRLDTIQAAILLEKLDFFLSYELKRTEEIACRYNELLHRYVKIPTVKSGYKSAWAQYTIATKTKEERDSLQVFLKQHNIPTNIYYPRPLHEQHALKSALKLVDLSNAKEASESVLSLPIHAFISDEEVCIVSDCIASFMGT